MRKRRWIVGASLYVAAFVFTWVAYYDGGSYTKVLTAADVQQRINVALEKREATNPKVHVRSAQIDFADDQIHLDTSIMIDMLDHTIQADVHATGVPEYRAGAFYFHPITTIILDHFSPRTQQYFARYGRSEVAIKSTKLVQTIFSEHPIYRIKDDVKGIIIREALEKVEIKDDTLQVTVSLLRVGFLFLVALFMSVIAVVVSIGFILNPELLLLLGNF